MRKLILTMILLIAGTILFQGFQCASPEFTSAKLKAKQKLWDEAEVLLEKELQKNPTNDEAWLLLAEVRLPQKKTDEAVEALLKAEEHAKSPAVKERIPTFKYNLWVSAFNNAVSELNKYYKDKDDLYLKNAISILDKGIDLRPQKAEQTRLKAMAYEYMGDTSTAVTFYEEFVDIAKEDVEIAKEKGFFLKISRKDIYNKLQNGENLYSGRTGQDSVMIDKFIVNDKDLYMQFIQNKQGELELKGWDYDPPASWLDNEKLNSNNINIQPYAALAQIYFDRSDYQKALTNVMTISAIDPSNVDANSFMVQIYQIQGKSNEAMNVIGDLVKANPDNKFYLAQYGEILFQMEKYDEAIETYERTLKIDPSYPEAMRNLASSYKNKAVKIQIAQQDKMEEDINYEGEPDKYFPLLRKSAEYFEKSISTPKYKDDFRVLMELFNIYDVLNEKEKIDKVITNLERIESTIPREYKSEYYLNLIKVYSSIGDDGKLERAQSEYEKYQ